MKVCPVCKSRCFEDMDICYGCLYKFKQNDNANKEELVDHIPEYFELEPFLCVEEESAAYNFESPEINITNNDNMLDINLRVPKSLLNKNEY